MQLRLDVYSYNALVEAYPKTLSEIYPGHEVHTYDFQSNVNMDYLGLSNFIMANADHVDIISPDNLKTVIKKRAAAIIKKME